MKIDAEMILEKYCPSMSNLYLDAQGRNFRDRVVNVMIEYHQTEIKKLSNADVSDRPSDDDCTDCGCPEEVCKMIKGKCKNLTYR